MTIENGMSPSPRSPHNDTPLTPYDTGQTLEPHLWIHPSIDHNPADPSTHAAYGRVDFDTDEGITAATITITRNPDNAPTPYTVTITADPADLTITVTDPARSPQNPEIS